MSRISNFFKALVYDGALSKNVVFKRLNCIEDGHSYDESVLLEKVYSEAHPYSDSEYIFTINIRQCLKCGLVYQSNGLEFRDDE